MVASFVIRFGIGAAEVELGLEKQTLQPGQKVAGTVTVRGGKAEQQIDSIYFAFLTKYKCSGGFKVADFGKQRLTESFTIAPDEVKFLEVVLDIPSVMPVTMNQTRVWIQTGLDIDWSLDPSDKDYIRIEPNKNFETLQGALHMLGFELEKDTCVEAPAGVPWDFIQEFDYRPRGGPFSRSIERLELVVVPRRERSAVIIDINHRSNPISELLKLDTSEALFQVPDGDSVHELTEKLREKLESFL